MREYLKKYAHFKNISDIAEMLSPTQVPLEESIPMEPKMKESGCIPMEQEITEVMLAHAYVPFQKLCPTFSPERALDQGTAFPSLTHYYWHTDLLELNEDMLAHPHIEMEGMQ